MGNREYRKLYSDYKEDITIEEGKFIELVPTGEQFEKIEIEIWGTSKAIKCSVNGDIVYIGNGDKFETTLDFKVIDSFKILETGKRLGYRFIAGQW